MPLINYAVLKRVQKVKSSIVFVAARIIVGKGRHVS